MPRPRPLPCHRRAAAALGLLAGFGVVVAGASASSSALPRALADRPDEVAGPQIQIVYAVPADGEDRHLDDLGMLEGSVTSFQRWLAQETNGRTLRMDTFEGSLDVTFVRLTATEAELAAPPSDLRGKIEGELRTRGFTAPGKIYAAYYVQVRSFTATPKARSGRAFRAILGIDRNVEGATCVARAGTRRLRASNVRLRGTRAECTWQLPRATRRNGLPGR